VRSISDGRSFMFDIRMSHFYRIPTRNLFFIAFNQESWGDAAVNQIYDPKTRDLHRSRPFASSKKSRLHHVAAEFRGR